MIRTRSRYWISAGSAALLAGILYGAVLPVQAGVFDDDEARKAILDLRSRVDATQKDVAQRIDAAQQSQLELANQIEGLRQELARLRGQIEVLNNAVSNGEKREKDFYTDLDQRLRKLEPQQVTVDGKTGAVDQNESRVYDAAFNQFKGNDYKGSIISFQSFLSQYPDSVYAPAAQYWIGTAYYAQRDYRGAIAAEQVVIKNWPDNAKASDALLIIASSQSDGGDKKAARKTLETLIATYPDTQAASAARDRLVSLR
ncbi:MAG: tol-pal system protein YbgF [Burkholderiaceae bacterium]|jgi:tol-pal system protein YbgF